MSRTRTAALPWPSRPVARPLPARWAATPLPDYELLELLLFRSIPRRDMKPIAKELLSASAPSPRCSPRRPKRLKEVNGVGESVVARFKDRRGAGARASQRARWPSGRCCPPGARCSTIAALPWRSRRSEQFRILFLDKRNALIADEVQQTGTVDHTPVYPREVVKRALELSASALILVHNHPSGDPTPSSRRHQDDPRDRRHRQAARHHRPRPHHRRAGRPCEPQGAALI